MAKILSKISSFSALFAVREPKRLLEEELIKLLKVRLKELKIIWNPLAFRGGLSNRQTPSWLLKKLESVIELAEAVDWRLSKVARDELDTTVEDIETFNPRFRESLKRESAAVKAGKFVTQEELEKRFGLDK